jgi:hypothetical protein
MFSQGFFLTTFGFEEEPYEATQLRLLTHACFEAAAALAGGGRMTGGLGRRLLPWAERCVLKNLPNSRTLDCGGFSTPSVAELRKHLKELVAEGGAPLQLACQQYLANSPLIRSTNVVGESFEMHLARKHEGCVFQAASQFNYLEFPSAGCIPENGIDGYMYDRTQGPVCAMACGAGTAYRNYLVPMSGTSRGQRRNNQLDGLADVTNYLSSLQAPQTEADPPSTPTVRSESYYQVKNGYVNGTARSLQGLNKILSKFGADEMDQVVGLLRVGVQEQTQVTAEQAGKVQRRSAEGRWVLADDVTPPRPIYVSQVYCSALSIAYSQVPAADWELLARLVLKGTYEATLLVGCIQTIEAFLATARQNGGVAGPLVPTPVLLTKVGGGVFGNPSSWIVDAILASTEKLRSYGIPLELQMVHYGALEKDYASLTGLQ